jgi:hypothetical protein
MSTRERLIFLPLKNRWRVEQITPDGMIFDFQELTSSDVASRFCKNTIAANLRKAVQELEML